MLNLHQLDGHTKKVLKLTPITAYHLKMLPNFPRSPKNVPNCPKSPHIVPRSHQNVPKLHPDHTRVFPDLPLRGNFGIFCDDLGTLWGDLRQFGDALGVI